MELQTVEKRMMALTKKYSSLRQGEGAEVWKKMIDIIRSFQEGRMMHAFTSFYELFCTYIERMRFNEIPQETKLYRMRQGKNDCETYTSEEMFHIPFELNHLVGNERFSISGFPSLYLGGSVYVCWEELRRPSFEYASIALFKTRQKIRVLDLSIKDHYSFTKHLFSDCLTLACSLQVAHPKAPFKPEYIIPQLLMQALVEYMNIHKNSSLLGIQYTSVHVEDYELWINFPKNRRNRKLFFNYVFPAVDRKPTGCSDKLNNILEYKGVITYNKLKLMYPAFASNDEGNCKNAFELIENYLNTNILPPGMLTYDDSNLKGAKTC